MQQVERWMDGWMDGWGHCSRGTCTVNLMDELREGQRPERRRNPPPGDVSGRGLVHSRTARLTSLTDRPHSLPKWQQGPWLVFFSSAPAGLFHLPRWVIKKKETPSSTCLSYPRCTVHTCVAIAMAGSASLIPHLRCWRKRG